MIPAYNKEIPKTEKPQDVNTSLEEQVQHLQEQVRILRDSIEYSNRERSRMKSEIDSLRYEINRRTGG